VPEGSKPILPEMVLRSDIYRFNIRAFRKDADKVGRGLP
jgi:hypothetical protein